MDDATAEARVEEAWELFEHIAGDLAGFEAAALVEAFADEGERAAFARRQADGHTSILLRLFVAMMADVTPAMHDGFAAAVRAGADAAEEDPTAVPGALVGLGAAMADFAGFLAWVHATIAPARLGRRRRMELAVVATARFTEPGARAFVVAEAERYAAELARGHAPVDTAMYALYRALDLEPALGGRILGGALAEARWTDANRGPAIVLAEVAGQQRACAAAVGLRAALAAGLADGPDEAATRVRLERACELLLPAA